MKYRAGLLFLLIQMTFQSLYSQFSPYTINSFTTINGLAHNQVNNITQDGNGFLWLATWDGLSRFDGTSFKNYYHDPDDSTSLTGFEAKFLCIDKHKNLWILSDRLCRYNQANDNFIRYTTGSRVNGNNPYIYTITKDTKGNLVVLDREGIKIYDDKKDAFKKIKTFDKIIREYISYINNAAL